MLERKIWNKLDEFFNQNDKKALLITGARQVGKTYIIREFGKRYKNYVEINFIDNEYALPAFINASNSEDLLLRISVIAQKELIPNETLIFLDEVQECKEIVTAIKFLVDEGSYDYILSGSMLGVDLKDIKSVPVGYMDTIEMFPLDFEEFVLANGISRNVITNLRNCFDKRIEVGSVIHDKMMELFRLYLVVGGMPAVVNQYVKTNNMRNVLDEQKNIVQAYKRDIGKYDINNKLYIQEIFDLIPSELNAKNKRFILKNLNENFKFSRYENSFIWLKDAGVALPTYCVEEPKLPLMLSKSKNLFKLFASDVGLLASMYMNGIQMKILNRETDINFGSVYENVVAQELRTHGFDLYYFNSKKQGELDFVIEYNGKILPLEIKSGKEYTKHSALNNVLGNKNYDIKEAFVLGNDNVKVKDNIIYYPMYMLMFIQKNEVFKDDYIYKIDLSELNQM